MKHYFSIYNENKEIKENVAAQCSNFMVVFFSLDWYVYDSY